MHAASTDTPGSTPPDSSHYNRKYFGKRLARLSSYRVQARYVLKSGASDVLIVGKGDGIVEAILERCGVGCTTLDIQPDLAPDIVGSVEAIPANDGAFETSVCCQVLEHLPFDRFGISLRELHRVTRSHLVLSLPDQRPTFSVGFDLHNTGRRLGISIPKLFAGEIPRARFEKMGHHWEIGYRGTGFGHVRRAITEAGWLIDEVSRVPDLAWHTFFYCRRSRT